MLEHPEKVVEGAKILLRILGIKRGVIGIELNKPDAINAMNKAAKEAAGRDDLTVAIQGMEVKYPQGSEKQLIYSLTKRSVPGGGLPFDVGVIVQNISTTLAVFEAVTMKKPLYEKVVTVSGRAINRQANLKVKVGTSALRCCDLSRRYHQRPAEDSLGWSDDGICHVQRLTCRSRRRRRECCS